MRDLIRMQSTRKRLTISQMQGAEALLWTPNEISSPNAPPQGTFPGERGYKGCWCPYGSAQGGRNNCPRSM